MSTSDVKKNLFDGLGKATLRGVRRCPKCGTFNGTRGVSCKNKQCDVVFKEAEQRIKKAICADAVKVVTGSTAQLFSVRVRDRGPDYRGFVQLPFIQDLETPSASEDSDQPSALDTATSDIIDQSTAKCLICKKTDSTPRLSMDSCWHMKAAVNCYLEAVPLTLKNSVLNNLSVSSEIKQAIWCLATETTGPLVQRVSKNVMVVKCKPNPKHSLGFLHFSFFESSKKQSPTEPKFHCSCKAFKSSKLTNKTDVTLSSKEESPKRCVHFYSCICAFASDDKLSDEFSNYINLNTDVVISPEHRLLALYSDNEACDIKVEVVPSTDKVTLLSGDSCEIISSINDDNCDLIPAAKRHKGEEYVTLVDEATGQTSKNILFTLLSDTDRTQKPAKSTTVSKKPGSAPSPVKKQGSTVIDESHVSITFHQWLASVTERINQTMHYQFSGNPDPLVFHCPQCFFECLQQRISSGFKKKRLPNSTTAFVRKDALPLGTFTKYSWQITNILHVKQIFDTKEMPLQITRSFVQNRDRTYDLFVQQESDGTNSFRKTGNNPLIKPFELKTYLRVGNTSPDQKEPTPFIIEWIPDILPAMKIGELRINFEYGHQRNGHLEVRHVTTDRETHFIQVEEL